MGQLVGQREQVGVGESPAQLYPQPRPGGHQGATSILTQSRHVQVASGPSLQVPVYPSSPDSRTTTESPFCPQSPHPATLCGQTKPTGSVGHSLPPGVPCTHLLALYVLRAHPLHSSPAWELRVSQVSQALRSISVNLNIKTQLVLQSLAPGPPSAGAFLALPGRLRGLSLRQPPWDPSEQAFHWVPRPGAALWPGSGGQGKVACSSNPAPGAEALGNKRVREPNCKRRSGKAKE